MEFAARLSAARRRGGVIDDVPALDLAAGYAVAACLDLGPVLGWKIGATSAAAQAFLGVTEPIHGRLTAGWGDGAAIALPGARVVEAEPEIVVRLGPDLEPDAAWAGAELVRPSFADPFAHGVGAIVADNAASLGVLLGPMLPLAALDAPDALRVRLLVDGEPRGEGMAGTGFGDPRRALAWLRGALADDRRGLRPGDLVATGALCRAVPVPRGATFGIDAPGHGTAAARLV